MRSRYPTTSNFAYSFGPGPWTPAIKILICVNVGLFVLAWFVGDIVQLWLGMQPAAVVREFQLWRPITYMFVHSSGSFFHILFNMLTLWMFGVELERMWGSKFFVKYYFVCGVGAAATTLVLSFVPLPSFTNLYTSLTVGASGAIYGILLAYALYFPNRPIYMYMVFPIPAKYFVMIMGAISLLSSMGSPGSGIAHTTHLGGLVAGYLYLKGGRTNFLSEIQYRYLKWRINRMRRRFDVYSGGRADGVDRRVH
jgi:membrane associated rhomboid family serine protease